MCICVYIYTNKTTPAKSKIDEKCKFDISCIATIAIFGILH